MAGKRPISFIKSSADLLPLNDMTTRFLITGGGAVTGVGSET
jgi:hypothetical protein